MKLLPSLRQKKRYIAFNVQSETPISLADIQKDVELGLHTFLGDLGIATLVPLFIKEKSMAQDKNQKFIIKVNHTGVDQCKAALILIKKIKNVPVIITSVIVSGTLKKVSLQ